MLKWLLATPPKIGSRWVFPMDKHNPFGDFWFIVKDVKDGYVSYVSNLGCFNYSTTIRNFRSLFREL